jgi:indole-3-glycerol phosphate synthase
MGLLDEIVFDVRRRVAERQKVLPLDRLRSLAAPERKLSFVQALSTPQISLVAEVKRVSPPRGMPRPPLEVGELVRHYESAGAAAISVCTEEDHYRGSLEDLIQAVAATSLPVLRDDFVVDEYQLHEARVAGASAVLLMAAILPRPELLALGRTARRLGLDVVVEVPDERRLEEALALEGAVVGIDGTSRSIMGEGDVSTANVESAFRLISLAPCERQVLVRGGVANRADVARFEAASVDGLLVGERMAAGDDVEATIQALLGFGADRGA